MQSSQKTIEVSVQQHFPHRKKWHTGYMLSHMVKSVCDIFHKTVQEKDKNMQFFNCGFLEHFLLH